MYTLILVLKNFRGKASFSVREKGVLESCFRGSWDWDNLCVDGYWWMDGWMDGMVLLGLVEGKGREGDGIGVFLYLLFVCGEGWWVRWICGVGKGVGMVECGKILSLRRSSLFMIVFFFRG